MAVWISCWVRSLLLVSMTHALEVQLAVHLEGAAEGRDHALASVDAGALGHEDLGLAGLHIELEQHAAGALAVGFAKVHVARVHGLDECGGLLGGQAEACHIAVQNGLHAEAAVHGADVDPVAGGMLPHSCRTGRGRRCRWCSGRRYRGRWCRRRCNRPRHRPGSGPDRRG